MARLVAAFAALLVVLAVAAPITPVIASVDRSRLEIDGGSTFSLARGARAVGHGGGATAWACGCMRGQWRR
jgi:hypothetical protein